MKDRESEPKTDRQKGEAQYIKKDWLKERKDWLKERKTKKVLIDQCHRNISFPFFK